MSGDPSQEADFQRSRHHHSSQSPEYGAQMRSAKDRRGKGADRQTRAHMKEQREVALRTLEAHIGKERLAEMIARGELSL